MEQEVEDTLDPQANISPFHVESTPMFEPYGDNVDGDEPTMPSVDEWDADGYHAYIGAQVALPHGDRTVLATVQRWKHDLDGNPVGSANCNPILDTRCYEVKFPDGKVADFMANIIAEN